MSIFVLTVWLSIALLLYLWNRDLCSPSKILHVYALVFFLGFYFSEDTEVVSLSYLLILLLICMLGLFEALSLGSRVMPFQTSANLPRMTEDSATIIFVAVWILTILPLFAQLTLIQHFGGLAAYISNLAFRVKEFAGLGPLIAVIKILPVLNIVYFSALLTRANEPGWRWLLFVAHLLLTVSIGLLSGSRSLVLMNFFWMVLVWNNLRRPVSLRQLSIVGVALVGAGFVLGTAREVVSYSGIQEGEFGSSSFGDVVAETADRIGSSGTANSGLDGLRLVLEQGVARPQYGLTFLTGITNFVPRAIWPDKPRSGGIVLTQDYTGDAWSGFSNLSTGAITESMLNFGIVPGFILGLLLLTSLFVLTTHLYVKCVSRDERRNPLDEIVTNLRYIWLLQLTAGLLLGEFANSIINFVLQLLILAGILLFARVLAVHFFPSRFD